MIVIAVAIAIVIVTSVGWTNSLLWNLESQESSARPISLLRLSLLRFVDPRFPEIANGHENSTP